jgi:hypothetical protein
MKSLSVKLGVVLFVIELVIFGNIEVWGADWKYWYEEITETFDDYANLMGKCKFKRMNYYDRESIARPERHIVKVWTKSVDEIDPKSQREVNEYLKKKHEKLEKEAKTDLEKKLFGQTVADDYIYAWRYYKKYEMNLYEFNCLERTYWVLENSAYDKGGALLNLDLKPFKRKLNIIPESVIEKLYKKVCR